MHQPGVNRYEAAEATVGRVIVGRILPGSDFMQTIAEVCEKFKIEYGIINFAFGTLRQVTFKYISTGDDSAPTMKDGSSADPVAFLGGVGIVCRNDSGKIDPHFHGAFESIQQEVHGGHFMPNGNVVMNTTDFSITELIGAAFTRTWDEETSTIEMKVEQR